MKKFRIICHDCNAKEGELHQEDCDMEICPRCKGQLLSCDCKLLSISKDKCFYKLNGKAYRREPFLISPIICVKCGKLYPILFNVSNKEWKETIGITFKEEDVLCMKCFNKIRKLKGLSKIKLEPDELEKFLKRK